jgi:hypothetical protein
MCDKTQEFIKKAIVKHGDKYNYSKVKYVNNTTKVIIICKEHGDFEQQPNNHLMKKGCLKCSYINASLRNLSTTPVFIKKAKLKHGDKYDYSKVNYVNNATKVIIICNEHGDFEQTPADHLSGCGCQTCGKIKQQFEQTDDKIDFINKAIAVHGNKYDYSKVEYVNCKTKVIIVCKIHGDFQQIPIVHTSNKCGCAKCGIQYVNTLLKSNTQEFINKSILIHGDKYDYSNVEYTKRCNKVKIICKLHGEFEQNASEHLCGSGCKKCSKVYSPTTDEFIENAVGVHGEKYDYSNVNYKKAIEKIIIICKKHGEFQQRPNNHLSGSGCPKCHNNNYSKKQIEWLNFIQFKDNIVIAHALNEGEFNIPNTKFKADGFCKETNTIYEFHGDYWHGNQNIYDPKEETYFGKTFGELYEKTLEREKQIKDMGFNLISIWESDWIKINKCVKILQQKFRNYKPH